MYGANVLFFFLLTQMVSYHQCQPILKNLRKTPLQLTHYSWIACNQLIKLINEPPPPDGGAVGLLDQIKKAGQHIL